MVRNSDKSILNYLPHFIIREAITINSPLVFCFKFRLSNLVSKDYLIFNSQDHLKILSVILAMSIMI